MNAIFEANVINSSELNMTSSKFQCELRDECVAYTFSQSQMNCILHSSVDKGLSYTRGQQTGMKKTDYMLSLPEISFCSHKNRQKRCRREPKCQHVDCLRIAWNLVFVIVSEFEKAFELKKNISEIQELWLLNGLSKLRKKNWIWRRVHHRWIWVQFREVWVFTLRSGCCR